MQTEKPITNNTKKMLKGISVVLVGIGLSYFLVRGFLLLLGAPGALASVAGVCLVSFFLYKMGQAAEKEKAAKAITDLAKAFNRKENT